MISLVSDKTTNHTVKRMYRGDKAESHLRTEIVIITPILNESKDKFREMLFQQQLGKVLKEVNLDIEEKIGELFECDVESIYTVAKKI